MSEGRPLIVGTGVESRPGEGWYDFGDKIRDLPETLRAGLAASLAGKLVFDELKSDQGFLPDSKLDIYLGKTLDFGRALSLSRKALIAYGLRALSRANVENALASDSLNRAPQLFSERPAL